MTTPIKNENVMANLTLTRLAIVVALLLATAGCRENPIVGYPNVTPVAVAWVVGESFQEDAETRRTIMLPFDGEPVEVRLDGTRSHDDDGSIVTYRWLSATSIPDAGGRLIPGMELLAADDDAGATPAVDDDSDQDTGRGFPADEGKPRVMLPLGIWTFALWVIDNKGAISDQDTVTIQVGDTGPAPEVLECVAGVLDVVSDECQTCICSGSDDCRAAVVDCNEDCWGLIGCIADNCPDFAEMAAATPPDYSCLTGNCSAFLAGSTQAGRAGDCVVACTDECATP